MMTARYFTFTKAHGSRVTVRVVCRHSCITSFQEISFWQNKSIDWATRHTIGAAQKILWGRVSFIANNSLPVWVKAPIPLSISSISQNTDVASFYMDLYLCINFSPIFFVEKVWPSQPPAGNAVASKSCSSDWLWIRPHLLFGCLSVSFEIGSVEAVCHRRDSSLGLCFIWNL